MKTRRAFGELLRDWRQRRHLSQLELANRLEISSRHLSFTETGRSQASRAMILKPVETLMLEAFHPADEFTVQAFRRPFPGAHA